MLVVGWNRRSGVGCEANAVRQNCETLTLACQDPFDDKANPRKIRDTSLHRANEAVHVCKLSPTLLQEIDNSILDKKAVMSNGELYG